MRMENTDHIIAGFQNVDALIIKERKVQEKLEKALKAEEQSNQAKRVFMNSTSAWPQRDWKGHEPDGVSDFFQENDAAFHVKAASDFLNRFVDHVGFYPARGNGKTAMEAPPGLSFAFLLLFFRFSLHFRKMLL